LLHPDGRSFTGELETWGARVPVGAHLLDRPARHQVVVRLSKGAGTRRGRPDVRGLAIRVHGAGRDTDILLSTTGTGRLTRHVPVPRRGFDAYYGSITAYRAGERKVYLAAGPDPAGPPLGRTLESVVAVARRHRAALLLYAGPDPVGRVTFGAPLPPPADAALAFDPVRNAPADLHPVGLMHGVRAFAYRASRRWRGASVAG